MIKLCIIMKGQEYMVLNSGKSLLECIKRAYALVTKCAVLIGDGVPK